MSSSNVYAKQYSTRRPINESEQYKLVLFPGDNSIAVVKSKQCSPAEHDGFFHVQSGRKKFTGVVLEEGNFAQCSKAADRLTKKTVNPEIESDYERAGDENRFEQAPPSTSTISTLNTIPFGNHSLNPVPTKTAIIESNENTDRYLLYHESNQRKDLVENSDVHMSNNLRSLPLSADAPSSSHEPVNSNNPKKKRHTSKTTTATTKRRKHCEKENTCVSFDDVDDEGITSDSDLEQTSILDKSCAHPNRSSTISTPTFVGRHVTTNDTESTRRATTSSMFQQLLGFTSKLEAQYLRPLLVAQERSETMIKNLYTNQQKIQKTLRKQKMNISLIDLNETNPSVDNQSFLTSLEYKTSDGQTVDLLKRPGVKEHANRFVTSLMDILYKPEQLLALETDDVSKDERYLLLKEAVRNKFRLNQDELETIWMWLHTVFLAKRRTLKSAKNKQMLMNVIN